jgi:hypothetical protein
MYLRSRVRVRPVRRFMRAHAALGRASPKRVLLSASCGHRLGGATFTAARRVLQQDVGRLPGRPECNFVQHHVDMDRLGLASEFDGLMAGVSFDPGLKGAPTLVQPEWRPRERAAEVCIASEVAPGHWEDSRGDGTPASGGHASPPHLSNGGWGSREASRARARRPLGARTGVRRVAGGRSRKDSIPYRGAASA